MLHRPNAPWTHNLTLCPFHPNIIILILKERRIILRWIKILFSSHYYLNSKVSLRVKADKSVVISFVHLWCVPGISHLQIIIIECIKLSIEPMTYPRQDRLHTRLVNGGSFFVQSSLPKLDYNEVHRFWHSQIWMCMPTNFLSFSGITRPPRMIYNWYSSYIMQGFIYSF